MGVTLSDPLLDLKLRERDDAEHFISELKQAVIDRPGQTITDEEKELIRNKQERISTLDDELTLLGRDVSMRQEARDSLARISPALPHGNAPIQYRDAGEYVSDVVRAMATGDKEAGDRIARYFRAAEHILTSDIPGIVPDPIVGPVLDYIDGARPIVSSIGPVAVPAGPTFHRPVLTDANIATGVTRQTAEKAELASKKFTITRLNVTVDTYGGYVNVSRQDLDWGQNSMGIIVNQLAERYARTTEGVAGSTLAATTTTAILPANPTAADILKFLYTAQNQIYSVTSTLADIAFASPDMWAKFGSIVDGSGRPMFPAGGDTNTLGSASPSSRVMNVAGFPVVLTYALPAGTVIVTAKSLVEIYEQRLGTLQVVEPSVLGVQVAYAGYFTVFVPNGAGVVKNSLT